MIGNLQHSLDGAQSGAVSRVYGGYQESRDRSVRGPLRPPRRAQSTNDYVYPSPTPSSRPVMRGPESATRTVLVHHQNNSTDERPATIQEEGPKAIVAAPPSHANGSGNGNGLAQRPKMGQPRRSYSVMDYEPLPLTHRPSADFSLSDLPPELHYAIFDYLDPIDSTCLGLTSRHFYAIHKRLHGPIPLSVRRTGPNDMEWVWHLAGHVLKQQKSKYDDPAYGQPEPTQAQAQAQASKPGQSDAADLAATTTALRTLRVRGQALCRKCGIVRCELHKHIQDWMGPNYEYCTVREKFGRPAPEGAKAACYRSNPKDPRRCGRHRQPKSPPTTPLPQ